MTSFAIVAVLGMIIGYQASAQTYQNTPTNGHPATTKTIAETLKSLPEASTFVKNAEKTGMMTKLREKEAVTVLVPINSAFEAIPAELREKIAESERMQKALTSFHILKGNLSLRELQTTVEVETFCDEEGNCTMNFVEITRPSQDLIIREIPCSNGRIYLINAVLVPEYCKRGILERTGEALENGAHKMGKAVANGAKDVYNGSRTVISHGLDEASKGLHKGAGFVAPKETRTPSPEPKK